MRGKLFLFGFLFFSIFVSGLVLGEECNYTHGGYCYSNCNSHYLEYSSNWGKDDRTYTCVDQFIPTVVKDSSDVGITLLDCSYTITTADGICSYGECSPDPDYRDEGQTMQIFSQIGGDEYAAVMWCCDRTVFCTEGEQDDCGSTNTNEGECSIGIRTCQADNSWGECVGEVGPTEESCNSLDDDCDGEIDESGKMISDIYVTQQDIHDDNPSCDDSYVEIGRIADCGSAKCEGFQSVCAKYENLNRYKNFVSNIIVTPFENQGIQSSCDDGYDKVGSVVDCVNNGGNNGECSGFQLVCVKKEKYEEGKLFISDIVVENSSSLFGYNLIGEVANCTTSNNGSSCVGTTGNPRHYFFSESGSFLDCGGDISLLTWDDMNGNEVNNADVGDSVQMIVSNTGLSEGTEIRFEVFEKDALLDDDIRVGDDAIVGVVGSDGNAIGVWTITQDDLGKTNDLDNFKFKLQDDSISDLTSADLVISDIPNDSPMELTIMSPECGKDFDKGDVVKIKINADDEDSIIDGNISVNGAVWKSFGNGINAFDYTFSVSGNFQIVVSAVNNVGKERGVVSNVMILDKDTEGYSNGKYVAACIYKPKNFMNFGGNVVDFDASTTRAVEVVDRAKKIITPESNPTRFNWYWRFMPEGITKNHFGEDGSFAYKFTAEFPIAGDNSASLRVEFD